MFAVRRHRNRSQDVGEPHPSLDAALRMSLAALTVLVVAGLLALPAQAAPNTSTAPVTQPASYWGVEIDRTSYRLLTSKLVTRLRKAGVNTLVVRPGTLTAAQTAKVRTLASRGGLSVLVPLAEGSPSSAGTVATAHTACRALKLASAGSRCAVYAQTRPLGARHRSARSRRRRSRQGRPRLAQGSSHRAGPRRRHGHPVVRLQEERLAQGRDGRPLRPRRRPLGRASHPQGGARRLPRDAQASGDHGRPPRSREARAGSAPPT